MKINNFYGPLFFIPLPFILFECLKNGLIMDPTFVMPRGHFYIVSFISLLATVIAIAVGIIGKRIRNIKVSFLSLSFISLAQMFAVHGLSTPNFMIHTSHLPGVAAQLSMVLATVWLWLSSFSTDNRIVDGFAKKQRLLVPFWTVTLCFFGFIGFMYPEVVGLIPINMAPLNWILTAITTILNSFTIYRYYHSYRFSRFPLQLSIVYSSGWLIVSQLIMVLGKTWQLSWWIYHFLLLASMIVMLAGLIKQYLAKGKLSDSFRALFTTDPFERVTGSSSPSVKSLIVATERKDTYTAGHTFRVTLYALYLAEAMNMKQEQLRVLAQGGLLHDVGKINIPDTILNKPGKLTSDERLIIESHPSTGYEMCRELGFMKEELSIIRSHHERWDGSGYPDQLKGTDIPLLARIVAVADVYDALTSERSYRKAWSHHDAIKLLVEQKGTHFDPECVDAWVHLCERNPSVYQYPAEKINEQTTSELLSSF